MAREDAEDTPFELSAELKQLELQFAHLAPTLSASWQSQIMFKAGLKRGQQEARSASWKAIVSVACLAAGLSAWATFQGLSNTADLAIRKSAHPTVSTSTADGAPSSVDSMEPSFSSTPTAISPSKSDEQQLDELLARHLPTKLLVISELSADASVTEPSTLRTLSDYRNQLRESL